MIKRVCAAIIHDSAILMVHHQESARNYWTLPGGHVEPGEYPEEAIVREVQEEVCLPVRVVRTLFDQELPRTYSDVEGAVCRCYLVQVVSDKEPAVGYDPEEVHLHPDAKLLRGIAWRSLQVMKDDLQVSRVVEALEETS